jgi:hypothetical protein
MIDIHEETVIPVREIPARIPDNPRTGKKVNLATVFRWSQRGVRGIKLETILIGGTRHSSLEALQRFSDRATAVADGATSAIVSTPPARRKAHEKASRELDEAGI